MKTFDCLCGNTLFFESTTCLKCGKDTGLCPECRLVTTLLPASPASFTCGNDNCRAVVSRCANFSENGCSRCILLENGTDQTICDYCALTTVIPDLNIDENRKKWTKLEKAKRQILYVLDLLQLPYRTEMDPRQQPLSFEFKADGKEPVFTGHEAGVITINIREADDVEREMARQAFAEPQRTLVGHFRHELGHYFWERLVLNQREPEFRKLFGDERSPTYADALKMYHETGAPDNWQNSFISAYATMHPWEDFAETFGGYLDMVTVLLTAADFGIVQRDFSDVQTMVRNYQQVGVMVNEFNRDMGLIDLVSEVFLPPVIAKLEFVHSLVATPVPQTTPAMAGRSGSSGVH